MSPQRLPGRGLPDLHFWRTFAFSAGLAGLVAFATTGRVTGLPVAMLGSTLAAFAAFYLAFPRGLHIAVAQATLQAAYMCVFVFFLDANFPHAAPWQTWLGFALPVAGFLTGALAQRQRIGRILASEHMRRVRFDHVLRWGAPIALIGAATFLLPDLGTTTAQQGLAFLAAMALIGGIVGLAARDVVIFILDTSLVFEAFFARITHLMVPVFAFLTFWALLAIGFACLYRIADLTTAEPLFTVHGAARRLEFAEALYFSVVTLATVGYGDISPVGPLARMLAVAQMVAGLLLLLFGVNELIRHADGAGQDHRQDRHPPDHGHR